MLFLCLNFSVFRRAAKSPPEARHSAAVFPGFPAAGISDTRESRCGRATRRCINRREKGQQ